jgi:excisionase family DNA binding protein
MNNTELQQVFTPEQVAEILQLSKGTIYELIKNGEIIAKRLGNVYRIPKTSIAFAYTGLDWDIYQAEMQDKEQLEVIHQALSAVRAKKSKK